MNSYRNPKAQWIPSPNFELDRDGHDTSPPFYIVMHTVVGWSTGAVARFQNADPNQPGGRASAHYIVKLDGGLIQMVDEKDAAWHAGDWEKNLDSIGIEHEDGGQYNSPRPLQLKQTSAELLAEICKRYGLACDRSVIRLHKEVSDSPTACPDALEVDEIIGMAQAILAPPAPPKPEWQANLKANAQTFVLTQAVPIVDMTSGAAAGSVPVGPLSVAWETQCGGVAYWVTDYAVQKGLAHGLRKIDVAAAVPPPADPRDAQIADLTGKLSAANTAIATLQKQLADRDAKDVLRRAKAQELVALL
jgi:N-acetylmuramoyl-L-alanine amidase